jgi:hypothetical protein
MRPIVDVRTHLSEWAAQRIALRVFWEKDQRSRNGGSACWRPTTRVGPVWNDRSLLGDVRRTAGQALDSQCELMR